MQNDSSSSSSSFRREAHHVSSAFNNNNNNNKNPPGTTDLLLKNISPDSTLSFDFQDLHSSPSPSSLSGLRVTTTTNNSTPSPLTTIITSGIPSRDELKSLSDDHHQEEEEEEEEDRQLNSGDIFSHETESSDMVIIPNNKNNNNNSVSHHFHHPNLHDNLHVTNMVESFICYDDNNEDDEDEDIVDKDIDKRRSHSSEQDNTGGSDPVGDNESTFDCNDSLYLSNLWEGKDDEESIGNNDEEQKIERKVGLDDNNILGKENNKQDDQQVCQDMIENNCRVLQCNGEEKLDSRPVVVVSKSVSVFSNNSDVQQQHQQPVESQKWFFETPGSTTNFSNATTTTTTTQQHFETNVQSKLDNTIVLPVTSTIPVHQDYPPKNIEPPSQPNLSSSSSRVAAAMKKYKWKPNILENDTNLMNQQTNDTTTGRASRNGKTFLDNNNNNNKAGNYLTKKGEKRKPRTYSQAIPSQHCHICSRRPTETSPHAVCGNLLRGRCRKTICTKCFQTFRWDLKAARDGPPGSWECPHCRGECPQRAQCVIYNRTSDRRRLKLINHRKRKATGDVASGGGECKERGGGGGGGGGGGKRVGGVEGLKKKSKSDDGENNNKINVNEVNNNNNSNNNALRNSTSMMMMMMNNNNNNNSLSCGGDNENFIIGKEPFLDGMIIRSEEIGAWNNPDQIANFGQLERALAMDLIHQPNTA